MNDSNKNIVLPALPLRRPRRQSRVSFERVKEVARHKRVMRRLGVLPPVLPTEDDQQRFELGDLDSKSVVDLKKRFPISRRLVLRNMFPWMLGFTFLIWFYWHSFSPDATPAPSAVSENATMAYAAHTWGLYTIDEILLYGSAIAILTVMGLYHELQRVFFQYKIEGFRLIIHKGIVLIEEGSLPLLPIAEVYARRRLPDLIFGIYQVHVAVPVDSVRSFAKIEGLSKRNATLLIDFLSAQLSRQISVPEEQKRVSSMGDFNGHNQSDT